MIETAKPEFEKAFEHLEQELKHLRSGRANVNMVENLPVESYGSTVELKGVASITTPDAKTIQIEPWDKDLVKEIEKALMNSKLGLTPNVAGTVIRLVMPPMTEENRKELVKVVNNLVEQARIRVRKVREDVREKIQAEEKAKNMSEDEKFRLQEQLDKVVGEYNKKIEELGDAKEKEVMTI